MNSWKKIGIFAFSALSLGVVACGGSDGAAGPAGAAGAKGDTGEAGAPGEGVKPSAGVVFPNIGLLDRELDVTITGDAIDFTAAAPTVDFGAGVTVSKVQVLSGTTFVAHLAVDVKATTGARDVKITEGSTTVTAKAGFTVAAPIALTASKAQQGGFLALAVDNLDTQHAFDATYNAFSLNPYANFELGVDQGGLIYKPPTDVTATHAEGAVILIDPLAPASTNVIAANTDGSGSAIETYSAGAPLPVAARTPTALTIGTPLASENFAAAGSTNLYKYNTSAISILELTATATGTTVSPEFVVYGASGKGADLKAVGQGSVVYPTPAASTDAYVTAFDSALGGGAASAYGYSFGAVAHTATAFNEPATAHATLATATAITAALPAASTNNGVVVVGAVTTGTEEDWYSISLAQNDNLEIVIDSAKDITVDLVDGTSTTILSNGPISGGKVESVTQTVAAAGSHTYYVHVTATDTTAAPGGYLISLRKR